ncbi:MAG: hypothetical protein IPK52_09360 [Chloroflexi bacterium]|nr:hypothetical protein [Chloroflexota bacterium]
MAVYSSIGVAVWVRVAVTVAVASGSPILCTGYRTSALIVPQPPYSVAQFTLIAETHEVSTGEDAFIWLMRER